MSNWNIQLEQKYANYASDGFISRQKSPFAHNEWNHKSSPGQGVSLQISSLKWNKMQMRVLNS